MSSEHAHHEKPDHVPHISPISVYLKTFGALAVLTTITVAASYVNLGTTVNLAIALAIATTKAVIVAAFFMHLAHDHKFHTVIFGSSLVFLTVFITFTMLDTENRGKADPIEKERPLLSTDPFAVPVVSASAAGAAAAAPAASATPKH